MGMSSVFFFIFFISNYISFVLFAYILFVNIINKNESNLFEGYTCFIEFVIFSLYEFKIQLIKEGMHKCIVIKSSPTDIFSTKFVFDCYCSVCSNRGKKLHF